MSVPLIPGFRSNRTVPRSRTQGLSVRRGVMVVGHKEPNTAAGESLLAQVEPPNSGGAFVKKSQKTATLASAPDADKPTWLKYNSNDVLRFPAYFEEQVEGLERVRVRRVVLIWHLAEGVLSIQEPHRPNAGMPQGKLLRKSPGLVKLEQLEVGTNLTLNRRTYHIYDASARARQHVREHLGKELAAADPVPDDPYEQRRNAYVRTDYRKMMNGEKAFLEARHGRSSMNLDKSLRFYKDDGKVLRFWGISSSALGDTQQYAITYFVADSTVQVVECGGQSKGAGSLATLLKRSPLPKDGHSGTASIANLGGLDEASTRGQLVEPADLRVGECLDVYGRSVLLCRCDDWTRQFLTEHVPNPDGSRKTEADFQFIQMDQPPAALPRMPLPPPTGFGSEQDSLGSFYNLVPKPPRKDGSKERRWGNASLRFRAALAAPAVEDEEREFIVTYFLADDTVTVFEPPQRNSGFAGGRFYERAACATVTAPDLYTGAVVTVNSFRFRLGEADEHTLVLMEENPHMFPQADLARVGAHAAAEGLAPEALIEAASDAHKDSNALRTALSASGVELTAHECITLQRAAIATPGGMPELARAVLAQ